MKFLYKKILSICFMLQILLVVSINAQTKYETKYFELNKQITNQQKILDSLNVVLQKKINVINLEKKKTDSNKTKILKLLSGTAKLTNRIEKTQKEINIISTKLNSVKNKLANIYSTKIDSVKKLNISKKKKDKLLIKLIEKKLFFSPKIDILTFEPKKILLMQTPKDSVRKKIYFEYLTSAKKEVENKIKETKKLKSEIENIILLGKESQEFLEESGFDNDVVNYASANQGRTNSGDASLDYSTAGIKSERNIAGQTASFFSLINQLNISSQNKKYSYNLESLRLDEKNNIYNFKKLIVQVENLLTEYLSVISNKLKNVNH